MTILIITSSYPAHENDVSSAAGLFIRDFARALVGFNHRVLVSVAARKESYLADPGIEIIPIAWQGGEGELASYPFSAPSSWPVLMQFFRSGSSVAKSIVADHAVDRILCMWIVPAGIFGLAAHKKYGTPFDVWALGSDVWRIQKLPFGEFILRRILRSANNIFADGPDFARLVGKIAHRPCLFLPSSRSLPRPKNPERYLRRKDRTHFLFVGRYHINKGPDLLVEAISMLPAAVRERVWFDFFGYGHLRRQMEAVVDDHNLSECLAIHGTIEAQEFSDRLATTDFLVIPSRIESIPVVLSDAMQRGVPVIATDVGDMGSIIRRHDAGIVVSHPDPAGIRDGILKALELGRNIFLPGVALLASEFDISAVAERWLGSQ